MNRYSIISASNPKQAWWPCLFMKGDVLFSSSKSLRESSYYPVLNEMPRLPCREHSYYTKNRRFQYWLLPGCVQRCGSWGKACLDCIIVCWWEMCLYQKQGIVSRSIFCCLIPLCAEIGRNAWRVVSDSLESSYWANAESLVVAFLLSLGEQSIFHCPACSEPRPLAAARLFLRYVCSVFLIRKIRQSGEWKRLLLMSLMIQRENGEAVNEAAENGELGVTVKCCCFFLSSNHS